MKGSTSVGPSAISTGERLTNTGKGVIMVGRLDFKGNGMDIPPYNTLRAAKGLKTERKIVKNLVS